MRGGGHPLKQLEVVLTHSRHGLALGDGDVQAVVALPVPVAVAASVGPVKINIGFAHEITKSLSRRGNTRTFMGVLSQITMSITLFAMLSKF